MSKLIFPLILFSMSLTDNVQGKDALHLFILSGQSNMAGLAPDESFTPAVQNEYGKEQT